MERFEYYTHSQKILVKMGGGVNFDDAEMMQEFNKLGEIGWELVKTVPVNRSGGATQYIVSIFKRKIG